MVFQAAGFLAARALVRGSEDGRLDVLFRLDGATLHPAAIVLHMFGGTVATLVGVLAAIGGFGWVIARCRSGPRLLGLHLLGTLVGGGVFFCFALGASDLATVPLTVPVGGLAACAVAAWRCARLHTRPASRRGFPDSAGAGVSMRHGDRTARIIAIVAWGVAGVVFFFGAAGATGWLLAAGAGAAIEFGLETAGPRARFSLSREQSA